MSDRLGYCVGEIVEIIIALRWNIPGIVGRIIATWSVKHASGDRVSYNSGN